MSRHSFRDLDALVTQSGRSRRSGAKSSAAKETDSATKKRSVTDPAQVNQSLFERAWKRPG